MKLDLAKLDKMMENTKFIDIAKKFLPESYYKMDKKEKLEALNKMEEFLANFGNIEPAKVVYVDPELNYSYANTYENVIYLEDFDDVQIIDRLERYKHLYTLHVLLHESAHILLDNKSDIIFDEKEKEVFKLNMYLSPYNRSYSPYFSYDEWDYEFGNKRHFLQPLEFFADKTAYKLGEEIIGFLDKKLDTNHLESFKNMQKIINRGRYSLEWYEDENYLKDVYPLHLRIVEGSRQLKEKEIKLYKTHKETDEKLIKNHHEIVSKSQSLYDLIPYFFPTVWRKLERSQKEEMLIKAFSTMGLSYSGADKYLLNQKSIDVLGALFVERVDIDKKEDEPLTFNRSTLNGIGNINYMNLSKEALENAYKEYTFNKKKYQKDLENLDFYKLEAMYFFLPQAKELDTKFIKPLDFSLNRMVEIFGEKVLNHCDEYRKYKRIVEKYQEAMNLSNEIIEKSKEQSKRR